MDRLDAILTAIATSGDKNAEAELKAYDEDPRLVLCLLNRIDVNGQQPEGIQTLCCVLLSWRLPPLWERLNQEERETVQRHILTQIQSHHCGPVLRTLAELAQVVAQCSLEWPELLQCLLGCTASASEANNEPDDAPTTRRLFLMGSLPPPPGPPFRGVWFSDLPLRQPRRAAPSDLQ